MKNIIQHRYLIYELIFRDLKLLYRKPYLGFFWMLIIPFTTAFIYKILFSDFFRASSGAYPFFIHLITAILPWNYFASSIQDSTRCIMGSKNIISQASFPKYLLPVSRVGVNLINFIPSLVVLIIFLAIFKIKPSTLIIFLPVVILIQSGIIIGLSLIVSSLQVIYRDTEYIVQLVIMALFFLTPSVYTLEELICKTSPLFTKIYLLNPLVGIVNLYRIILIEGYLDTLPKEVTFFNTVINPLLWALLILWLGHYIFKKTENKFFEHLS